MVSNTMVVRVPVVRREMPSTFSVPWHCRKDIIQWLEDLWPYVLLGLLVLFLLDLYAKRVRLFGYRTFKFQ